MPVELRKRKAVVSAPAPPAKKKIPAAKAAAKVKESAASKAPKANGSPAASKVAVGNTVALEGFGGEIETHDGRKTNLKKLVDESEAGVVLFTYPKASTPGCTTQACLFRDSYESLSATGLSIFGLSTDSPKANTSFKEKQGLPYTLLCDPSGSLISAIGLKKAPKGTTRGVFVVDKSGKVLVAEPGGPAATVEVVKKLVESSGGSASGTTTDKDKAKDEKLATNGVNGSLDGKEDSEKVNAPVTDANATEKPDGKKVEAA